MHTDSFYNSSAKQFSNRLFRSWVLVGSGVDCKPLGTFTVGLWCDLDIVESTLSLMSSGRLTFHGWMGSERLAWYDLSNLRFLPALQATWIWGNPSFAVILKSSDFHSMGGNNWRIPACCRNTLSTTQPYSEDLNSPLLLVSFTMETEGLVHCHGPVSSSGLVWWYPPMSTLCALRGAAR